LRNSELRLKLKLELNSNSNLKSRPNRKGPNLKMKGNPGRSWKGLSRRLWPRHRLMLR